MAHTLPLRNSFIWVAGRNGHASAAGGARHPALVACEGPMRTTCRRPPSSPYVFSRGSIPAAGGESPANGARPGTTSTPAHPVDHQGGSGIGVLWDTSTPHTPQSGWGCAELWSSWRARRRPTGGSGPRPERAGPRGLKARTGRRRRRRRSVPRSWNRTGPRSGEDRCALGLPPQASSAPARVSARRTARVPTQRLKSRAGLTDTPRSAPPEPHD